MFSFLYDFLNILNQFIIEVKMPFLKEDEESEYGENNDEDSYKNYILSDDSFDDEYDDENDEDYFDIIYYYKYLILEKT